MSLEKVQQGLLQKLTTAFTAPTWLPAQFSWENITFTPPGDAKPWMSAKFMPASEIPASLGASGENQHDGLLQIDINYPQGVGEGNSRQTIEQLFTCYPQGSFHFSGQQIKILSRVRGPGRTVDGFYRVSLTVRWRAFINRN